MTVSDLLPVRYQALRLGPAAARVLSRSGHGYVNAVFDRSFYFDIAGDYVCVGSKSLGMCPLNVITSAPEDRPWVPLHLYAGLPVRVTAGNVSIGGRMLLRSEGAAAWVPPETPECVPEKLAAGLSALETYVAGKVPQDGLGRFLVTRPEQVQPQDRVMFRAAAPVHHLLDWLDEALADPIGSEGPDASSWQDLLGLGPGLTPSGDDLVGGMMLALHGLELKPALKALCAEVGALAGNQTNPISAAHLKAAMEGAGSAAAHTAMGAIVKGDREAVPGAIQTLSRVGHTSGWDTLAGMVMVLRSWLIRLREQNARPVQLTA